VTYNGLRSERIRNYQGGGDNFKDSWGTIV